MKKLSRSPVVTGLMFMLAVVLLFAGTVGGTQAALQVYSSDYLSAFDLDHIGVTLLENNIPVAYRNYGTTAAAGFTDDLDGDLVLNNLGDDSELKIGKDYDFEIKVRNTGTIDQYVRVTIYKSWVIPPSSTGDNGWFHGENSTKIRDDRYDLDNIELFYYIDKENDIKSRYNDTNWIKDTDPKSDTPERDIYYYKGTLVQGEETEALLTTLRISPEVAVTPVKTTVGNTTYYTYAYDGLAFVVKAEVDAIQTHNYEKAIRSAWGLADNSVINAMK